MIRTKCTHRYDDKNENILIQIREWTQGKGYLAVGGIGNGKLRSVGEVSPKGEKIISGVCPGKCRSVSEGIC